MNLDDPKDKELYDSLEEFAEDPNKDRMIHFLLSWPHKSLLWMVLGNNFINSTSTTDEHREAIKKAQEAALAEDEELRREFNPYMVDLPNKTEEELDDDFDDEDETPRRSYRQKKESIHWEGKDMKPAESYILSDEDLENETAEQAYQRLLDAEKVIGTSGNYDYFENEYQEYQEGWREKESIKTSRRKLEKWEKKHFKLDEGFKEFLLKHGYISFGTNEEIDALAELSDDMRTLADAFLHEYEYSREQIDEWYPNFSHLENLYIIGYGVDGMHFYILMDKEGGFYLFDQDDWDTIDERYSFDQFVSTLANFHIKWMLGV